MKKRILTIILSLILTSSLVIGCGGTPQEPQDSGTPGADSEGEVGQPSADVGEPITITIMDSYAPEDPHGQYIYEYADAFMDENPNITVEIQAIASGDIYTKLAAMATSPDSLPTVFFTSADQVPTLYDLGLTEDLANILDEETISGLGAGIIDACILDGEMTYYPVAVQPQGIIYRIDRFEEAGLEIPATWDDFIENAKVLTKDSNGDGEVDQWGFSMIGSNNSSGQTRFMSYLWSHGYDLAYQEDGSGEWKTDITTDPEFVKIFSKWIDMNNVEGIVPVGITEVDYPTAANYFAMGYTSMFLTGPNALGVAYSSNPDLEGKLGSFMVPGEHLGTMLGAEGYAVSAHATDAEKEAAAKYLKFFTSHDKDMKFWEASGKIPSTIEGQSSEFFKGEDYAGFLEQIEEGYIPTLEFPGVNGLKSALGNAYSAAFSNEKSNEEAVEALVKELEQLFEDYN